MRRSTATQGGSALKFKMPMTASSAAAGRSHDQKRSLSRPKVRLAAYIASSHSADVNGNALTPTRAQSRPRNKNTQVTLRDVSQSFSHAVARPSAFVATMSTIRPGTTRVASMEAARETRVLSPTRSTTQAPEHLLTAGEARSKSKRSTWAPL